MYFSKATEDDWNEFAYPTPDGHPNQQGDLTVSVNPKHVMRWHEWGNPQLNAAKQGRTEAQGKPRRTRVLTTGADTGGRCEGRLRSV
jgi:hypothetical protein